MSWAAFQIRRPAGALVERQEYEGSNRVAASPQLTVIWVSVIFTGETFVHCSERVTASAKAL
jgi:hypothetical protein